IPAITGRAVEDALRVGDQAATRPATVAAAPEGMEHGLGPPACRRRRERKDRAAPPDRARIAGRIPASTGRAVEAALRGDQAGTRVATVAAAPEAIEDRLGPPGLACRRRRDRKDRAAPQARLTGRISAIKGRPVEDALRVGDQAGKRNRAIAAAPE